MANPLNEEFCLIHIQIKYTKKCENIFELPYQISGIYSVIHKGYFYYFKYDTNNIIKYDLNEKKILLEKNYSPRCYFR